MKTMMMMMGAAGRENVRMEKGGGSGGGSGSSKKTTKTNMHHQEDKHKKKMGTTTTTTTTTLTWKQAVEMGILAVVLYQIMEMGYVFYSLAKGAAGPYGTTLAVTDTMSAKFPTQMSIVQRMVNIPIFPNTAAKTYYEEQHETFEHAAEHFQVHPYWFTYFNNNATLDKSQSFRELLTERMKAMYKQFELHGRMDYRIEKDRRAQFDFFRNNNIPHPPIKKTWYDRDELIQELELSTATDMIDTMLEHKWPIFFKACHLTQRSSLGTFPISSNETFVTKKQELIQWIKDKWVYRSRDVDRPWQKEGDALTDILTPCILVQEPMTERRKKSKSSSSAGASVNVGFQLDGRVSAGLVEMKVEVLWGRVYLMQIDGSTIFRRNGDVEDYSSFRGGVLHMPGGVTSRTAWIRDGGYLHCVVDLAEKVAYDAHIDYIRVDIFLDKTDPTNCQVNEISLSSGYAYFGHEKYMAKLWSGPLYRKSYQVFQSSTPVYELVSSSSSSPSSSSATADNSMVVGTD